MSEAMEPLDLDLVVFSPPYPDRARIDRVIEKLRVAWHRYPNLRLGQLIGNLTDSVTYYDGDATIEAALDAVIEGKWDR